MELIDVEPAALRARAADLDRTARSLASGLAEVAGLTVAAPAWATAAALADLHAAVSAALGGCGAQVAEAAGALRTAAADYAAADDRAAERLSRVG
jgi:uncharacterized protein YukE